MTGDEDRDETDPPAADPRDLVDAASAVGQRKAQREVNRRRRQDHDFWAASLADPVGRRVLWELLSQAGAFTAPFAVGPNGFPQPEASWFKAGQQAFALGLYHQLMAVDHNGIRLMLEEHDSRFRKVSR